MTAFYSWYYFVQCTLKGKKENSVSVENPGKRALASTTVLNGSPSPCPLWPSGLWERECGDPIISNAKIKLCMHVYFEFLKMAMPPNLSQFQLLPKWWRATWLVSRVYLNNWPWSKILQWRRIRKPGRGMEGENWKRLKGICIRKTSARLFFQV